jgi:hypothetical protein
MHVIKRHGRWASDAVYLYIVDSLEEQLGLSARDGLRSSWVFQDGLEEQLGVSAAVLG